MNNLKDLLFLHDFISENKKAGKLDKDTADKIEILWNKHKLNQLEDDCSIICADFGLLGSLQIRHINTFEPKELNYKAGSYDFISIKTKNEDVILWTDYKDTEPYNRQGGLYCGGNSFSSLGASVKETSEYREFKAHHEYKSNTSFGVWGFSYNDYYGSVRFGICLKTKDVDNFISELRILINK